MKTLIIICLLMSATSTHAKEPEFKKGEAEVLTLFFFMCPTCVIAHMQNRENKKTEEKPKKNISIGRNLASEPSKESK